jgi:predicted nucleic acid-binding protein
LFDERTPERMSMTKHAWDTFDGYNVFISDTVVDELSNATDERKRKMLDAIADFAVLKITSEIDDLADEYVRRGVFPDKYRDDAVHVATAAVNGIGLLLSWNFTHLVKVKTRRMVALVNTDHGFIPVEIISPPEL